MAFTDLAKKHGTFIAGHVLTETIDYKPAGSALWQSIQAVVTRRAPDPFGNVLANRINVYVSRTAVPVANVGQDLVRLPADQQPGEVLPQYRVDEILSVSPGGYELVAIK